MPVLVNGEIITRDTIREEVERLGKMPEWQSRPDGLEKQVQLQQAAELCTINRVLIRQEAEKDSRPIDPELIAGEVQRRMGRDAPADPALSRKIETDLRLLRTMRDLMGPVPKPTEEQIAGFHVAHGHHFQRPETVCAAHIVKHIDATRTEEEVEYRIR